MSLFNKTEIKPEMESFIAKGKGVGIVKVDGYGKASARIESYKIILESYKDDYPIIESISSITFLSYDPGNFFQEPKLVIGLGQKEYSLAGVDDNDDELEAFYKSILNLKNSEKKQKVNSQKTEAPIAKDKNNVQVDELDELEEELGTPKSKNDTASKIKGFLSKRFDDSGNNKDTVSQENNLNNKIEENDDLELILDENEELTEEDETINIEEPKLEEPQKEKTEAQKIEDMEDVDEFDEIEDFDDFEVDEEIIIEDEFDDEDLIIEEETEEMFEENSDDEVIVDEPKKEVLVEEKPSKKESDKEGDTVEEQKVENIKENSTPNPSIKVSDNTQKDLKQEISKVKEQVNEDMDNINQEISNQTANNQNEDTFDPVYQIRRYYELKEDGIITEEEFELKKKQLLGLSGD